jgi:hypothetical protein
MSIRKARRDLQKLKESVAPMRPLLQQIFIRYQDKTEIETLACHGLDEWSEDATIVELLARDRALL